MNTTANLLFTHDDEQGSLDCDGFRVASAAASARPVSLEMPENLADISADANKLDRQRWALVVPEGADGRRLEALVGDLVTRRANDQGCEVEVVRVPPGLDPKAAARWKKDIYAAPYRGREYLRPRYLCILGDVDGVSLATQQALAQNSFPGRLVCDDENGYEAYVEKVLRWERHPSRFARPRSLFYTVHDGTRATSSGYEKLMRPCFAACQEAWSDAHHEFPAHEISELGSQDEPEPDEFLDLAASPHPSVLFSLSHGMGPPRGRRWTRAEALERQGAMSFGSAGPLTPSEIAEGDFLPGGMWLYFACFGAGTPSRSNYHHWLEFLADKGMESAQRLRAVLSGLATEGGFTSGLARAALANPDGPLAIAGHVDLAWSYSYEELRINADNRVGTATRADRFVQPLAKLVKGERAGAAMASLQLSLYSVSSELNTYYDELERAGIAVERADQRQCGDLGHLWMSRQDLAGYVLLGDPAARLPLAHEPDTEPGGLPFLPVAGSPVATGRFAKEGAGQSSPARSRAIEIEEAVLDRFAGRSLDDVASEHAVSGEEIDRWVEIYRQAGLTALMERTRTGDL